MILSKLISIDYEINETSIRNERHDTKNIILNCKSSSNDSKLNNQSRALNLDDRSMSIIAKRTIHSKRKQNLYMID